MTEIIKLCPDANKMMLCYATELSMIFFATFFLREKLVMAFSYLLSEKFSCSAMFRKKKKMQMFVLRDLLAGQLSCSVELRPKTALEPQGQAELSLVLFAIRIPFT